MNRPNTLAIITVPPLLSSFLLGSASALMSAGWAAYSAPLEFWSMVQIFGGAGACLGFFFGSCIWSESLMAATYGGNTERPKYFVGGERFSATSPMIVRVDHHESGILRSGVWIDTGLPAARLTSVAEKIVDSQYQLNYGLLCPPLTRPECATLYSRLVNHGLAIWRNPDHPRVGIVLQAAGRAMFRQLQVATPPPRLRQSVKSAKLSDEWNIETHRKY